MRTLLSVFFLLFSSSLFPFERFSRSQLLMGDIEVTITVVADSINEKEKVWAAMDKSFEEARLIEKRVSEWQPESDTSRLNQSGGTPPRVVSRDLLLMLLLARDLSLWTGGAFDVTYSSPDRSVTWQDVTIDEPNSRVSFQKPTVRLGVSGIAKGYLLDQMIDTLKKEGIKEALVNAAGDLRALGADGDKPWEVTLVNGPKNKSCLFPVTDRAVATSSNASERGLHIIDPHTRRPAEKLYSVTVFAPTSSLAGPLAVGGFVMGMEEGLRILRKVPQVEAFFIDPRGKMAWTKGLSPKCR